jgi:DNA-binding CsgD family transcriptional regulator
VGLDGVAQQLAARLRDLNPQSLRLAQAIAILGDGCELRHAAAISQIEMPQAIHLATELVRLDVLGEDRPPRFIHPIVQHAVIRTLSSAEHDATRRAAVGILHADRYAPERIAAHVMRLRAAGNAWVVERLREGARAALENGAPTTAADLLERALAEPPPSHVRVEVLREAARAELQAGRGRACHRLEEAMALAEKRVQTELASELAQTYATLFCWTDAVHVLERALASLGEGPPLTAAHLQSQLVAAGLQDARVAPRALELMKQMSRRRLLGAPAVILAVARGMVAIMTGRRARQAAIPLERALASLGSEIENWDLQAALWWSLLLAERFSVVEAALESQRERVNRSGSSRALVAVYSTVGLLKFRLGALPEADAAARVALQVAQGGDFAPGLPFAATVLADVAVASGDLNEAEALLDLLPHGKLPAGVGTVLIPAGRGRLRLAQGRPSEALTEFESCMALWRPETWGMEMRDVGYVHARSGAAQALLALGEDRRARELDVVRLACEGRSNRQIAQELYLSIKTVEGHLARAYGKLDITTRAELKRVLKPEKTRVPTL